MEKFILSLMVFVGSVGLSAQEVTVFGGYHTHLFGYTDDRYVDDDKGDYLKTAAWYSGAQYVQKGVALDIEDAKKVVLSGSLLFYSQSGFNPKDLYGVPSKSIAAKTVPENAADRTARFEVLLALSGGFSDEWWGAEGGLTLIGKGEFEASRRLYSEAGSSAVVEEPGRGWVFGNGSLVLPNIKVRLGNEKLPNFQIQLYRGQMDPGVEALQATVKLPFGSSFDLQLGGSFFPTSSIFLEPHLNFGDYGVALRAGTVLNYNSPEFTKVGILEGAYLSGAVTNSW